MGDDNNKASKDFIGENSPSLTNAQAELLRIYSSIKARKLLQIEEIEEHLLPLVSNHPELNRVLDIVRSWKPELNHDGGEELEGSHIL